MILHMKLLSAALVGVVLLAIAACTSMPPPRRGEAAAGLEEKEEFIRIAILQYEGLIHITVQGGSVVSGQQTVKLDSSANITADQTAIHIHGKSYSLPATVTSPNPLIINDMPVYGHIVLQDAYIINVLPLEIYVAGVLQGEVPASWPSEVLKAQAVVSRTYARARMLSHDDEPFHAGSSVLFQKYDFSPGDEASSDDEASSSNEAISGAVQDTAGEILIFDNQVIQAFFHACSGGRTENSRDVFTEDYPYLRSIPDPYCAKNERFFWSYTIRGDELAKALYENGVIDDIGDGVKDIRIHEKTGSGRAASFSLHMENGERLVVPGNAMRLAIDARSFKSLLITRINRYRKGATMEFSFEGRGYGHGVGMSQWGAKAMADQGFTYEDILRFYYRGTRIGTIWDTR
jgi:stage II sporulation protein D